MKLAKTLNLKNLVMTALLLSVAGCGCNDDSFPPGANPLIVTSVLGLATDAPGAPVPPPVRVNRTIPVDIVFVLDDGAFMVRETLGNIPGNPGDLRTRTFAAQRIYANLRANILQAVMARVNAARAADPNSVPADIDPNDFDFAFGVARYEDFGGPFNRRPGDEVARPFILQMPLLRDSNAGFDAAFNTALTTETPGNGAPTLNATELFEANTGLEALFQIATGNGFDGNGNGNTTDSGAPGLPGTQTAPGPSGDVPGVQFVANGTDADGEPIFFLADANGTPTTIPASGNIGGVGFRPNSARFVILTSDSATVTPLDAPPPVCPNNNSVDPADPVVNPVTSTAGGPDSPRLADTVELCGFNPSNVDNQQPGALEEYRSRFGEPEADKDGDNTNPNFSGVAPLGAATLNSTVDALNRNNIEVLFLGATQPAAAGGPTKPFGGADTAVNGDPTSTIEEVIAMARTGRPWSWFTGIARLTGAADAGPLREQSGDPDGNPNGGLPLVYNLGDVWLFDKDAPDKSVGNEAPAFLTPALVDDVADRIFHEHVQKRFLRPVTMNEPGTKVALPSVFYNFTLEIFPPQNPNLVRTDGLGNIIEVPNVQVPVWYDGDTPAAPVTVNFPSLQFNTISEMTPLPASDSFRIKITAVLDRIEHDASNADQAEQIRDYLEARGDGTYTLAPDMVTLIPNPIESPDTLETKPVCHTDATVTAIVRDANDTGVRGLLAAIDNGCVRLVDQTPGSPMLPQPGGTCPFPFSQQAPPSTPPFEFACPGTIDQAATQPGGAIVTYVEPIGEAGQTVTCTPPSGSLFPLGTTLVTCEATDAANMVVHTCTFEVNVEDKQAPVVDCPGFVLLLEDVESNPGQSESTMIDKTVFDQVSLPANISIDCNADYPPNSNGFVDGAIDLSVPNAFPVGTTIIECTATDEAGNTSQPCTITVRVIALGN